MDKLFEIERSIIKRYRKYVWTPFIDAINTYKLIEENDNICVEVDGSANSFLLAKCMQEIKKHGKMAFALMFLVSGDLNKTELELIKTNLNILNIGADNVSKDDLIKYVCEKKCNKLAVISKYEDITADILYNVLEKGKIKSVLPKEKAQENLTVIRPMFTVKEKGIVLWANSTELDFINKNNDCQYENIKKLIAELNCINELAETNIFKCVHNVNLNTVISYKKDGKAIHFLDNFND